MDALTINANRMRNKLIVRKRAKRFRASSYERINKNVDPELVWPSVSPSAILQEFCSRIKPAETYYKNCFQVLDIFQKDLQNLQLFSNFTL